MTVTPLQQLASSALGGGDRLVTDHLMMIMFLPGRQERFAVQTRHENSCRISVGYLEEDGNDPRVKFALTLDSFSR
jgi:hypothetical protein